MSGRGRIRSLVVDRPARRTGVVTMLLGQLRQWAGYEGFDQLCAFTHVPGYFLQKGFSIVPHLSIPEKIDSAVPVTCGRHA